MSSIQQSAGISLEIQRRLAEVERYNRWIFEQFEPYAGRRVLDVGCAIGNITQYFLDRESVIGVDVIHEFIDFIRNRFAGHGNFRAELYDIADSAALALKVDRRDTITCANVLEHVEDDRKALAHMYEILVPGGHALLLVPAFRMLWGSLDEVDDHFRRYDKRELSAKLREAGFEIDHLYYMNPLGMIGWLLNGKLLKRSLVPSGQYAVYNRIVPLLAAIERRIKPPVGLSLVAVARKPAG